MDVTLNPMIKALILSMIESRGHHCVASKVQPPDRMTVKLQDGTVWTVVAFDQVPSLN